MNHLDRDILIVQIPALNTINEFTRSVLMIAINLGMLDQDIPIVQPPTN
jgi:hypothetical protein